MKKITALALSLIMILCAVCALAESDDKAELGSLNVGQAFIIKSKLPEGYSYAPFEKTELNIIGLLSAGEGRPMVTVSIAYNEEYAGVERFNDVDEATVEEIRESFRDADPDVVFEDMKTDYDTRLLKATGNGFVDIYTIYKSYELEFVMGGENLTDADVQMLVDFISDMDFVPVE